MWQETWGTALIGSNMAVPRGRRWQHTAGDTAVTISKDETNNTHTNTTRTHHCVHQNQTLIHRTRICRIMVKKRLPDWLNSPMWSSPTVTTSPPPKSRSLSPPPPPPSSSNDDRYGIGSYPSKSSSVTSSDSSLNEPHVPLPPPTSIKHEPTPKTRIRDSSARSVNSDNDVSSSIEDVSRQAQLLEEVRHLNLHNQKIVMLLISRIRSIKVFTERKTISSEHSWFPSNNRNSNTSNDNKRNH